MGITTLIKRGAQKGADKIAKLSSLSPEQLENVQKKREEYLLQKPDPNDVESIELTERLLASASIEIFNAYLPQTSKIYSPIQKDTEYEGKFKIDTNIRYAKITKWVISKEEYSLEKLINVYEVLSNEDCNIGLVYHRNNSETEVYLSVSNLKNSDNKSDVNSYMKRLINAIKGNFPGTEFYPLNKDEDDDVEKYSNLGVLPCLKNIDDFSVASITNIPTEKSEKFISQTIEKLLDGIVPNSNSDSDYTIILLATPIKDIEERKLHLSEIYSGLAPYAGWQTNFTFTDTSSTSSSATFGVNIGASAGVQNGKNEGTTHNDSITDSEGTSESTSIGNTEGTNINAGANVSVSASQDLKVLGTGVGLQETVGAFASTGKTTSTTLTESLTKTLGKAITKGVSNTIGATKNISLGANFGANFARSSTITATVGKNEGITQSFTNHNIKHALEKLEMQMKRMDMSSALGFWDFGAYVISKDYNIANNVAHSYLALTQGEESFMSQSAINLWNGNLTDSGNMSAESGAAKEICSYLQELRHPVFALDENVIKEDLTFNVYPPIVTATNGLSGKELAYSLNFPSKSVSGLPVLECASFGRNISTYDSVKNSGEELYLGKIFHMNHEEETKVTLDSNSLTSHVFITGSTGSGKSNTVYQILSEAKNKDKKFLVIEPAKGEYKKVFTEADGVIVYGTNPKFTKLLKINPFSFPEEIHVLEHMDRLVEIFNVCWPMYAAMPAVLKEAIEKSYEDAGWDLTSSVNSKSNDIYPTFADVAQNIKIIIDTSEYDNENKGAYKGSLLTRLKSLTNGLNGQIFTSTGIEDAKLFGENVIIDLSRVGSQETKSLLMGILVLKLQEYRMTQDNMNADLNHITVLEEAHNLLKRTSTEQSSESANLAGKSVEMLTNAIAEMRTYGEGFIIADQAPALLDMAVIRNTNTKIIMRLPDLNDRGLVGKAANLNDDQITELAKLPCGVAAVYQNEWIEPVLCKVKKHEYELNKYTPTPDSNDNNVEELNKKRIHIATLLSRGEKLSETDSTEELAFVNISFIAKEIAIEYLKNPPTEPRMTKLAPIMAALFPKAYEATKNTYVMNQDNPALWTNDIINGLQTHYYIDKLNMDEQVRRDVVQALITQYVFNEIHQEAKLEEWTKNHGF